MNRLAMWSVHTDSTHPSRFSANIGEGIRLGVDLRSQYLYFSDYQTFPSNYATLGHTRADTTVRANGALEMALPIYISAQLSQAVQAFVKVDPITSDETSNSWEGYAIVHVVHPSGEFFASGSTITDAYLKAGAFFPAFGIRFDDHTVYTRGGNASLSGFGPAGLFWQPDYKDEGFELGLELFDHAFITADFLNGNEGEQSNIFKQDPFGPHAISIRGVVNTGPLMDRLLSAEIGGSLYLHTVEHLSNGQVNIFPPIPGDSLARTMLAGIHGGLHIGPLSILAEADFGHFIYHTLVRNPSSPNPSHYTDTAHALAIETAWDVTKGLTAIVRFDNYNEENADGTKTNIKTRFMVGAQWFPVRFLEIRPEFRIARGTAPAPEDPTLLNDHTETTTLLQTHIFF